MKRRDLVVISILLATATSLSAQTPPAPAAKSSAFTTSVAISVDGPPEMRWTIVDKLTRRLKNTRNLEYTERQPDWVIAVVAFDPFPKESAKKNKQFAMSTAFLQQMTWTDPALLEMARKDPCIPADKLGQFTRTQHLVGNLFSMGAYAGRSGELAKTTDTIVDDFVKHVLQQAKKNYEVQGVRPAQPLPVHQLERPKDWPPPPIKRP
jgi:hypothetical protein